MSFFDMLFGGGDSTKNEEKEENPITTSIEYSVWHPDSDERVLVMHEDCQILKNGGTSTASFQYLTYVVTTKRLVLVPQDCAPNRMIVSIIGRALGMGVAKSMLVKELCDNRLNSPVSISRDSISKVDVGCDKAPSLRIATVVVDGQYLYLGMAKDDYTFDLQASIYNPQWF